MSRLDTTSGAALVADALVRAGVTEVVVAPGSRSTPLVAAVAGHPQLRTLVVHDERSGAFVALGLARGSGRPAALVTTSGTAVANAMPAVVEADVDRVPLVIVTADRPPESVGTDANQTIDQRGFFGTRVRASRELPPPEDVVETEALTAQLDDALAEATGASRGPVHLNAAFRKPLEPVAASRPTCFSATPARNTTTPTLNEDVAPLLAALASASRPVAFVGAAADDADRVSLRALATRLGLHGVPVLACALSGLRGTQTPGVVEHGPLLAKAGLLEDLTPDVALWLGGAAVAPEFGPLAARVPELWRVDDRARRPLEFGRPRVLRRVPGDLVTPLGGIRPQRAPDPLFARDAAAAKTLERLAEEVSGLDEPRVARLTARAARAAGATLFVGNSMPVRDVDLFAGDALPRRVVANRGASGIDGLISTAAGVARTAGPTVLLVGDVSFLHDAGSLSALATAGIPLRIIVVDNRGGGIFDFLPVAQHTPLMPYFTTPHAVDIVALSLAYGVPARRVDDPKSLTDALAEPASRLDVVVVPVQPAGPGNSNVARHRAWYARVREAAGGAP